MKKLYISLFGCFYSLSLFCQQSSSGRVVNEHQQPVEFANIVYLSLPDSAFVTGTITKQDGTFALPGNGGKGVLRISSIGYKTQYKPVSADVGTIILPTDAQMLGEVVVKANLPQTRLKGDAIVTSIQNTTLSNLNNASDVLARLPGLVQKDNSVEVFGKGRPQIYINGRLVRNNVDLETLQAKDIQHIEVITNPGAGYDADVKAVVRVKTIPRRGDGFGINASSTYLQSRFSAISEQVDINYRHNSLDLFGTVLYGRGKKQEESTGEDISAVDTLWVQKKDILSEAEYGQWNFIGGANYQFNKNHSAGFRTNITLLPVNNNTSRTQSEILADGKHYDDWNTYEKYNTELGHPTLRLNTYYSGQVGKVQINWDTEYFGYEEDRDIRVQEESANHSDRDFKATNFTTSKMIASKLVFSTEIWKGELTWGGEYVKAKRDANYLTLSSYVPSSEVSIRENNWKAFTEYSIRLGKHNLTAGLRFEDIRFDYYNRGVHIDEQSKTFTNVYPSLSWAGVIDQVQMQLSYTLKTNRPGYSQLSSNVSYENRFTLSSGNPHLVPTNVHDITLNLLWKSFRMSAMYNQGRNYIINWSEQMPNNQAVNIVSYRNINNLPQAMVSLGTKQNVSIWETQLFFGVMKQWLTLGSGNTSYSFNKPVLTGSFNNSFKVLKDLLLRLDCSYRGQGHAENAYISAPTFNLNMFASYSIMKGALRFSVQGSDLLLQHNKYKMRLGQLESYRNSVSDSRAVSFTVRYRFNVANSKYKGTGAGQDVLDSLY